MFYDIVKCDRKYKGIERDITAIDVLNLESKKDLKNSLIEVFDKYTEVLYNEEIGKESFKKIIRFYQFFLSKGLNCEMIVYDSKPIEKVYGYNIEFLGIDITNHMCESLLEDVSYGVNKFLNKNGLCKDTKNIKEIVMMSDYGDANWEPCYVYKINI